MTTTTASAPPAAPEAGLWEDFIDIFYAPREVFARRAEGRWGLVLLVLLVVMTLLFLATQSVLGPVLQAEMTRAMQNGPAVSAEQLEQMRRMAGIFGLLGFVVSFPIAVLLTGVVLWAIARIFTEGAVLGAAILIATYSQFPRVLQQAFAVAQGLVLDVTRMDSMFDVSASPARFLDPDAVSPMLLAVASRFDLFILWSTVLIAIGTHVVFRLPRAQAWAVAVLVWLVGAAPLLAGALVRP